MPEVRKVGGCQCFIKMCAESNAGSALALTEGPETSIHTLLVATEIGEPHGVVAIGF